MRGESVKTFLRHDAGSGELHLVMADYWDGQHEETAYTVVNGDGMPLRGRADMDGVTVLGSAGDWYVKAPAGGRIPVRTQAGQRSGTVRIGCQRATNPRRKCAICAAGA